MSSKGAPPTHQLLLLRQKHLFALENGLGLPNSSLHLLGIHSHSQVQCYVCGALWSAVCL